MQNMFTVYQFNIKKQSFLMPHVNYLFQRVTALCLFEIIHLGMFVTFPRGVLNSCCTFLQIMVAW